MKCKKCGNDLPPSDAQSVEKKTEAHVLCAQCKAIKKSQRSNWVLASLFTAIIFLIILSAYNEDCSKMSRAESLIGKGEYEKAAKTLEGINESSKYFNDAHYMLADVNLKMGENYQAYKIFSEISEYKDAAVLAASCMLDRPETGVLYRNNAYGDSTTRIAIDATGSNEDAYISLYTEDGECVLSAYIRGGETLLIEFSYGTCGIKEAFGTDWFGEEDLFGDSADYQKVLFNSGADEYYLFDEFNSYTLNLSDTENGNIATEALTRAEF